jgi:2-polyprenyl-3-methyl-5-hydroxy-6-metoxy-1,4-benzoquinol methylase
VDASKHRWLARLGARAITIRSMQERRLSEIADQTETLFHVREIEAYNDWVFSFLHPFLGERVLEVGSGIGTYTKRIAAAGSHVVAVEPIPRYASAARTWCSTGRAAIVLGALPADVAFRPASFDSAVCLNVLEHLAEPASALSSLRAWLRPTGTILIQVPAHPVLFGSVDRALGHRRRYTAASLRRLLGESGFEMLFGPRYLYALAIPGWWLLGRVMGRSAVPASSVRLANAMVTFSRLVEDRVALPFGLTLLAGARPTR